MTTSPAPRRGQRGIGLLETLIANDVLVETPFDFSLTLQVDPGECGISTPVAYNTIQEITVKISRTGSGKPVLQVTTCKTSL